MEETDRIQDEKVAKAEPAGAKFEKDLTKGNVLKQMILFSLPFLLSNFIQALYNVGDMLIVGLFDGTPAAITAVNEGGQITILVTNIIVGFCLGGTVMIAQYLSRKQHEDIKQTIGTVFTSLMIAAAILSVLMIGLAVPLVKLMGVPAEAQRDTIAYVMICMAGNVFIFGYNGISAVLRGMGDSVRPLIIVGGTCALNIGLDALFVGPFNMGVAGAAIATVISQAIAMFAAVIYLYKKKFIFDFKLKSFKIYKDKLKRLFKIGLPASVQNAVTSLSFIFLLAFVNRHGVEAGAGAGIAAKINSLVVLPILAIGMAVTAMSAQNIGASMYKRAVKIMFVGMGVCLIVGTAFYICAQVLAEPLIKVFMLKEQPDYNQAEAIALGVVYLKAFSVDYIILAVFATLMGLINGSGHTEISMVFSLCSSIFIRVPLAYIMDRVAGLGFKGIAFAVPMATAVTTILSAVYVLTGKWKKNKLGSEDTVLLEIQ